MKKLSLLTILESEEDPEMMQFYRFLIETMKKHPQWAYFHGLVAKKYNMQPEFYVLDALEDWNNGPEFKKVQQPASKILMMLIQDIESDPSNNQQ